ncbi:hypothetical protein D9M72_401990 [compost metagenome]
MPLRLRPVSDNTVTIRQVEHDRSSRSRKIDDQGIVSGTTKNGAARPDENKAIVSIAAIETIVSACIGDDVVSRARIDDVDAGSGRDPVAPGGPRDPVVAAAGKKAQPLDIVEEDMLADSARIANIAMAAGTVEDHPVGALREVDDETVETPASGNGPAGPGENDLVTAVAAVDPVVAARARQHVVMRPAVDKIVAAAAIDRVEADEAPDAVAFLGALQNVARRRAYDLRHIAILFDRLKNMLKDSNIHPD